MNFYLLSLPGVETERATFLKAAAIKLKISCTTVDPLTFDFSKPSPVKKGDIVYRVSRGKILRTLENFFINSGVATFYQDPQSRGGNNFTLAKSGIPIPRTIFCANRKRSELIKHVETLGGFPIIIKVLGGTRGLGVMKVDSFSGLFSMIDYLLAQNKLINLIEYIRVKTSARFIVLGNKVIGSLEYIAKDHDFRTNAAAAPLVLPKKYDKKFEELAVKATHALGLEFGGVDILIKNQKPYITEVNFPCNFVRAQNVLKKNIALEMVKYLQQKAKKLK